MMTTNVRRLGAHAVSAGRQALPRTYSYAHARVTYTGAGGAVH